MNLSKQTTWLLLLVINLIVIGYADTAMANRIVTVDLQSINSVRQPDSFSWYYTADIVDENVEGSIPDMDGQNFRIVQVTQLRRTGRIGSRVLAESKDVLSCSIQQGNKVAVPDPIEFKFSRITQEWRLTFNGDVAIACRSIDIRGILYKLNETYCADRACAGTTFDICEEQGVVPCNIPVENIFVDAEVELLNVGTVFAYESFRFATSHGQLGTEIKLTDDSVGLETISPLQGRPNPGELAYIRIEQVDGGFQHHYNDEEQFVISQNEVSVSFSSAPPAQGEFNIYFGYDPTTGEYMTNGSFSNGIFDPYSSCSCGGFD